MAEKATLTGRFLQRKMDEYAALRAEIELKGTVPFYHPSPFYTLLSKFDKMPPK
jgi:hypothetical protein